MTVGANRRFSVENIIKSGLADLGLAAVLLVSWRTTGKPGKWAAIALAAACIALALTTLPIGIVGLMSNFGG